MERNYERIAGALKLPRESRERIRSQLASRQAEQEDFTTMKKANLKRRIPLIAAAIVAAMALTVTAAATGVQLFRNNIIVSSEDEIPTPSANPKGAPVAVGIAGPTGRPPATLEKITRDYRWKSDDWELGNAIDDGFFVGEEYTDQYVRWDFVEVLSSDPALRSRRVGRTDGAEKMEYTAGNPANLLDTLTGRVMIDLSWMDEQYDYVPDANICFIVTDPEGNYVGEELSALYAKPDESGYIRLTIQNTAEADRYSQSYIIEGSFETAYYYTTPDGYEFLIEMNTGNVWAECVMSHTSVSLYGAYLTSAELEDILDNLSLTIAEQ